MDLFFMNYLKDPEFNIGMLIVDIFTQFVSIIPMKANNAPAILEAMQEAIIKIGGKPQTLFTDDEGGLNTPLIQNYLKDHGIRHIVTRSHAAVAERTIRTVKAMIDKRIESAKKKDSQDKRWVDVLYPVLITYNQKNKHSATKMTPKEAMKPYNQLQAKANLELKRKHTRIYPDVNVGDYVKIYIRKINMLRRGFQFGAKKTLKQNQKTKAWDRTFINQKDDQEN